MVNIVVLEDFVKISYEIFCVLSRYGGSILCSQDGNIAIGNNIEYVINSVQSLKTLEVKNSVIVMAGAGTQCDVPYNRARYVFVSADDDDSLRRLCGVKSSVIVCGMSVRDTVSVTSIIGDMATVCIKRSFVNFSGEYTDECEIPIENEGFSDYSLMCAGAVLLLNSQNNC